MKKIPIILGFGLFLLLSVHNVFAIWQGPHKVVEGSWGTDAGQFGFVSGDPTDGFPTTFLIDNYNNIIIADSFNKRVQIIGSNGTITQFSYKDLNLNWKILQWPSDRIGVYNHLFVEGGFGKFQYYSYQGNLIRQFDVSDALLKMVETDGSLILQNYKTEKYYKYSATGQLLITYTEKPLELGIVKEQNIGSGKYKVTVTYPDKNWIIIGNGACEKYVRDMNGDLYCAGEKQVIKYSPSGKEIGRITMPADNIEEIDFGPSQEPQYNVIEEYGFALVAPNGDVYTWKRTPSTYSIIKWTWQDDPKDVGGDVQ